MLRIRLTASLATLFMAFSGAAYADRHHERDRGQGFDRRGDRHSERHDHRAGRHGRHAAPPVHAAVHGHHHRRSHGHHFHRGQRLPSGYHGQSYVVNDWRARHLHQPPHGHHWVQVGRDQMLVAIATGVIAQLIIGQ